MGLYETLVLAYDELFPPAPSVEGFLGPPPVPGALALDLGCATGAHVAALASLGWSALGVDPSESMIAEARRRYADLGRARFAAGTMLDVDGLARPGSASLVLCVGNTLPHLGRGELRGFLDRTAAVLRADGRLVVQLLNYSKLLAERPGSLPEIRAGSWVFRRSYRYRSDGSVVFATELEDSSGGRGADRGETILTPFTVDELIAAAGAAGFEAIGVHSSWNGDRFDGKASAVALVELRPGKARPSV